MQGRSTIAAHSHERRTQGPTASWLELQERQRATTKLTPHCHPAEANAVRTQIDLYLQRLYTRPVRYTVSTWWLLGVSLYKGAHDLYGFERTPAPRQRSTGGSWFGVAQ